MGDNAVMLANPTIPSSVIAASDPPVRATSQRPPATRRAALATAWVPAAHAVTTVSHGPLQPQRIEMAAAPALAIIMGTRKGLTLWGPLSRRTPACSSKLSMPPIPAPMITPARSGSGSTSPASSTAMAAAATLSWVKRSTRRASLGPNHPEGSKSRTRRSPSGASAHRPSQKASLPIPQQATTPRPVIANAARLASPVGSPGQAHV